MKRKIFNRVNVILLLLVISILCMVPCAYATKQTGDSVPTKTIDNANIYIHDLADLMTEQEETELIESIADKCKGLDYNILFLTTDDTSGKSTMVYSDDYMDKLFPDGTENNIAFVIDMDNRKIYINTMGDAIKNLSDDKIDIGLDRGYDEIKYNDYDGCLLAMASYCLDELKGPSFITLLLQATPCALIVAAVVVVVLILRHNKINKTVAATSYLMKNDYEIINKDETFIRSYETVQRDYYKPQSSSSGGGSSHRSSSGRSHGGGGRSF